ncbi:hypothetical protein PbB2_02950 [Candidatus Phycosocius bacilliformis]|uniref:Uncharacterized protein n=1 Tax=Candidatus Phycosocius bacilliformis TaxID=1445552 RepID=A0A2P2EDW8_9PROT|nr:PC4/YdbC family ssDNA-binding protein [Candidatus Phycosocius bacilliformis]GBF59258.1 hypothetical protein PbB2_02950 [Candidatus Phycosocius bacilliformis]
MSKIITSAQKDKGLRAEIERNQRTVVVISKEHFSGGSFVEIRIHYRPSGPQSALSPTKKGVTIPIGKADSIACAIKAIAGEPAELLINPQ